MQAVKNSFKHTLFALPPDGSRDSIDGGKRLMQLIDQAPAFEDLPEKHRFKVLSWPAVEPTSSFIVESVDDFGIRRRKKGSAEKYKNRAFKCELCGWS